MKWVKAENYAGQEVYIPETAIKTVEFHKDSVTIRTESSIYGHKFQEEQAKDKIDDCEHRFCQWLDSESPGWKVFLFTSF